MSVVLHARAYILALEHGMKIHDYEIRSANMMLSWEMNLYTWNAIFIGWGRSKPSLEINYSNHLMQVDSMRFLNL